MRARFGKVLAGVACGGQEGKASHELCQRLDWLCLEV